MVGIQKLLGIPPGVIESPEEEAVLNMLRTTEMVLQHSRQTLFADGISQSQFNVLMILRHDSEQGITQNAIARRLITTKGNLSQQLVQLEAAGLVRRRPGKDRRQNIVTLTPKGRRLVGRLEPRYREQIAGLFRNMTKAEVKALTRGIDRFRDNLPAAAQRRGSEKEGTR